jgi:ATP synthase F0 subunit b
MLIQPALLLAANSDSGGFLGNQELWRVLNLVVFVLILVYILRNKLRIGQVFDNRAAAIRKELETAKREKEEALARLNEVEARLSRLDEEVNQMRAEAEHEAAREAERIHQQAEADADKIQQMAHREIEGALKSARTELRAFAAEQAVEMAEAIIRREIRPEDNARILGRYVEELGEVNE